MYETTQLLLSNVHYILRVVFPIHICDQSLREQLVNDSNFTRFLYKTNSYVHKRRIRRTSKSRSVEFSMYEVLLYGIAAHILEGTWLTRDEFRIVEIIVFYIFFTRYFHYNIEYFVQGRSTTGTRYGYVFFARSASKRIALFIYILRVDISDDVRFIRLNFTKTDRTENFRRQFTAHNLISKAVTRKTEWILV